MYEARVGTVVGLGGEAIKDQRKRKTYDGYSIVKENLKLDSGLLESCKRGKELRNELGCHFAQVMH